MERILELLQAKGINGVNPQVVGDAIRSLGKDENNLSNEDVVAIAEQLMKQTLALGKPKQNGKQRTGNDLNASVRAIAKKSSLEIDALAQGIKEGSELYAKAKASEIVEDLRDTPNKVIQEVINLAGSTEEPDTEKFRAIAAGLFDDILQSQESV